MTGILVFFHCGTNAGFAIERLERVFLEMAVHVTGDISRVHFAYPHISRDRPVVFGDAPHPHLIRFDPATGEREELRRITDYVRRHGISKAFGFDQPPVRPAYRALRSGGVSRIVSYWGAPMSSINAGPRLFLKRLQVAAARHQPDLYVFESEAMRATGVLGRGLPRRRTALVHLGVDVSRFHPAVGDTYAHRTLGIPSERHIVFYSGHMEERKGVRVIVRAAVELVEGRGRRDVHFVLCGDRDQEADAFREIYVGTDAERHITFAGYRNDIPELMRSASLATIASTGWDSFTMSAVELAATGVPLIVSRLQGLVETIVPGVTGLDFTPGAHGELADAITLLLDDPSRRHRMGEAARARAVTEFSVERQVERLVAAVEGGAPS